MVRCDLCNNEYKQITVLHLRKKHNIELEDYKGKVIDDFKCENCNKLVTNKKSLRSKYCKECKEIINKNNVLKAVNKYNKKLRNVMLDIAYEEWNNKPQSLYDYNITKNHADWDYIPKCRNWLGTPMYIQKKYILPKIK